MSSVDWKLEIKSTIIPLKIKFTLEEVMKALSRCSRRSRTSALDGVGVQSQAPATLPQGKYPVIIIQEAEWAPGPL
jgi:hypothetical protein